MMQVSTKTEYGLRCMLQLARQPDDKALSLAELAERDHLPRPYAEQILLKLKRAGLVKSTRGTQGGFALSKPAGQITIGAILRVLEGVPFQDTCGHFNKNANCGHMGECGIRPVWELIARRLWEALDNITLEHLIGSEKNVSDTLAVRLPVLNFNDITGRPGPAH
jgi:Rrf2 family protein